ncbi:TonB-dependent receptor [Schlegelella sp. ID0723]|uniref:TonB-dependent receptor n=2 Tax=Piscinibacter koreensis TaxID=2742824 RepID=A0A7Y6NT61_9BURK|nr:TonB-dependent receptor [Schlegelella koreensis]
MRAATALALHGAAGIAAAAAPEAPSGEAVALAPISITGHYDNAVGTSDAASAGVVRSELLKNRPALRPGEVLEFVPGVIVTQHSGDGKANQYFLRGFNLDHGTDFATFVDGLPVNMPTHAHGHGYTDLNWLIPELVARIRYRKGPYAAEDGDFSSAGSARIELFDALPRGIASVTLGQDRFARSLVANSAPVGGGELLYALEAAHNDGPWERPENFRRFNGVLRYSSGSADARWSLTAMGYSARWNSTDQIPQRAVDAGLVGRYGAVDPSDGGRTERASLSFENLQRSATGEFRLQTYAIRSRLDLFSNFTYFLERPEGDQFEQAERRTTLGLTTSRSWNARLGGVDMVHTLGLQVRHDRLDPVGLYTSVARQRTGITQESEAEQTSVGIHGESALQWTPWLRSVAGLRADRYHFDVASSIVENSGKRSAGIGSPKLSLILGPWARTEVFVNYGQGFHSNDARGATARRMAKSDEAVEPATPLVRSKGAELGVRSEIVPGLQASLALWQLRLGSELLFVGDAGETEASRPSRRRGVELGLHYRATEWLLLDADLAASRARFTGDEPEGNHIPGSIDKVASLGVTVLDRGPWSGQFQLRYLGPRPLVEDASKRSKATTLAYLRVGYRFNPKVRLDVDVFNLFDRKASDIDYCYESRLAGEAAGVPDRHSHPVEPRRVRVTLNAAF